MIIDEEDFDKVRIETTETINIEAFVDMDDVDPIYNDSPYYLAPDGPMAEETFSVLREAMTKLNKTAIAEGGDDQPRAPCFDQPARQRHAARRRFGPAQEVRSSAAYFEDIQTNGVDKEMLQLAEKLIEQKSWRFQARRSSSIAMRKA